MKADVGKRARSAHVRDNVKNDGGKKAQSVRVTMK